MPRSGRLSGIRAVRHLQLSSALVVLVCLVVAGFSALSYVDSTGRLSALGARATGRVVQVDGEHRTVTVEWQDPAGTRRSAQVGLAGRPPQQGRRTEIAYDPRDPRQAIIPGATLLADRDAAAGGFSYPLVVLVLLLVVDGVLLARFRAGRGRTWHRYRVRRVRLQRGLSARSWLEFDRAPQLWVPVYFEPALVELPAPATVEALGDPRSGGASAYRLAPDDPPERWIYPSGRVRPKEPLGRRRDNAAEPDELDAATAATLAGARRQLRVDALLLFPAPFVGLFWAIVDGTGFLGWLGATVITGAVGLWLGAVRGSDPS